MELHAIGSDLGKTVFHLAGLDSSGNVIVRKQCSRTPLAAADGGEDFGQLFTPVKPGPVFEFVDIHSPQFLRRAYHLFSARHQRTRGFSPQARLKREDKSM